MKRFFPALFLVAFAAGGCALHSTAPATQQVAAMRLVEATPADPVAQPTQIGQHPDTFKGTITFTLNYLIFLPEDYGKDPAKKWPLMIFLHGSGERGNDVNMVKAHGPPKIVETQKDFPFILVSPQCPPGTGWHVPELNQLLDHIMTGYSVDADRVYATGLSMGGFATWDWATQSPDRFAAIAPMSGGGNTTNAHRIAKLPIWVFHGEADPVVPIAKSQEMVDALKKLGADVQFTHYPGVGHDCWSLAYGTPELYTWMLSHHRGETPHPGTQPAGN